jgi:hypothetical protein
MDAFRIIFSNCGQVVSIYTPDVCPLLRGSPGQDHVVDDVPFRTVGGSRGPSSESRAESESSLGLYYGWWRLESSHSPWGTRVQAPTRDIRRLAVIYVSIEFH